jgi:hypothetical protein
MKYGLYILRKYISTDGVDIEVDRLLQNNYLINYLASLLNFPDNSVRVKLYINIQYSSKLHGY